LLAPKHVRSPVIESWVALVTNGRKQGGGDATRRALTKRKPCWAHLDGTDGFLRVNRRTSKRLILMLLVRGTS